MDVLDVSNEILLSPNLMFPKTALPHRLLLFTLPRWRHSPLISCPTTMAKITFDQAPTGGKILIANGQGPDAMQMVWQNHNGLDFEGVSSHNIAESLAQQSNILRQAQEFAPVVGHNRKEEGSTRRFSPAIFHK
jgi:hypothetical protein